MNLYPLLRPLLFQLPPETAHGLTLSSLDLLARLGPFNPLRRTSGGLVTEVMGLKFPNPVGLAAGLDKNGDHIQGLAALGFGFIEVGTVTPRPQPGNPRPRLFRIPKAQALINRMGFNNLGIDHLVANLRNLESRNFILGVNLGKNKDTPQENAVDDYLIGLEKVHALADYVTINLSSPNTPGLRDLQHGKALETLLARLDDKRVLLTQERGKHLPMAIKIAPDLTLPQLEELTGCLLRYRMDAVIATNTTIDHSAVASLPHSQESGGLSGAPLREKSSEIVRQLRRIVGDELPIIACGGILTPEDAQEKFAAGAKLIQLYSGLIYQGPELIGAILKALLQRGDEESR